MRYTEYAWRVGFINPRHRSRDNAFQSQLGDRGGASGLKLFETTQTPRQYLRLVRYFWQGFEELNHFDPDLMPASGIEIGEVCGLFD
jgi:hypothetical protein